MAAKKHMGPFSRLTIGQQYEERKRETASCWLYGLNMSWQRFVLALSRAALDDGLLFIGLVS